MPSGSTGCGLKPGVFSSWTFSEVLPFFLTLQHPNDLIQVAFAATIVW